MKFYDLMFCTRIILTIALAWLMGELVEIIGIHYSWGYVLYVPILFLLCFFLDTERTYKRICPKRNTVSFVDKIANAWLLYVIPIFALIVACIHFRGYTIYKILRVFVACQSAFYVALFSSTNSTRRIILLFCFLVLAIMFFPIFGITMKRSTWQVIDCVFAILAIYTNLTLYDDDK